MLSFYKEALKDKKENNTHSCLWGGKGWMGQGELIKQTYERRRGIRIERRGMERVLAALLEEFCCKADVKLYLQKEA